MQQKSLLKIFIRLDKTLEKGLWKKKSCEVKKNDEKVKKWKSERKAVTAGHKHIGEGYISEFFSLSLSLTIFQISIALRGWSFQHSGFFRFLW